MQKDLHIRVDASPTAYWFIIVFLGLFAAMCLFSFFDRMSHAGPDEYLMLAIGLFLTWGTIRTIRYFLWPVVSVTNKHLVLRPFWKPRTFWQFDTLERFEVCSRTIKARNWMNRGASVTRVLQVEELVAVDKDGNRRMTTLPSFAGGNEQLLTVLTQRSGLPLDRS